MRFFFSLGKQQEKEQKIGESFEFLTKWKEESQCWKRPQSIQLIKGPLEATVEAQKEAKKVKPSFQYEFTRY